MNGHIGTKFTGYTALSSTTPQLLGAAALELPDGVREVIGIIPYITSPAGNTANEPIVGYVDVQSADVKVVPFSVLASPIGSSLLKSSAQPQGESPFYPMHLAVKGGESLNIYGNGLFNHTIEPYMGCLVIFSDQPQGQPQVYSKLSTFTNTGTAATQVSGGTVTIVGGSKIIELGGFAVGTTVATLKGLAGHLLFTSDNFTPSWTQHIPIEPASGQVDTNIVECIACVARKKVAIDISGKLTINVGFNLAVALTTTGNFVSQIIYN
jgi:hypothetical protein